MTYRKNLAEVLRTSAKELTPVMGEDLARKTVLMIAREAAKESETTAMTAVSKVAMARFITRLVVGLSRITSYRSLVVMQECGMAMGWRVTESVVFGLILRRIVSNEELSKLVSPPEPYFEGELRVAEEASRCRWSNMQAQPA